MCRTFYYPGQHRLLSRVADSGSEEAFLYNAVMELKTWSPHEREEVLSHLRAVGTARPPGRLLRNWDEAKTMQTSGLVSFGAHTANHVILDQVPPQEAEEEIVRSRKDIENHLGVIPDFFAYPNGNFTPDLKAMLKRHGFKGAVSTRKGLLGRVVICSSSLRSACTRTSVGPFLCFLPESC